MAYVIQGGRISDKKDQQSPGDAELLVRAQAGDGEAFGVLYERYAPPIHRYLYAHLSDRMDAEDLTEEVFLKVWQRLPGFQQQGVPFVAFLMRVARNVLIDHYRRTGRTEVEPLSDDSPLRDGQPEPADQAIANLEHQQLRRVLGQLREDYRHVLVARFLSGLSPEETAQVMGRSAGAVRVLQHRALESLRKLIDAHKD